MEITERRGGRLRTHTRTITVHDGGRVVATARPDRRDSYLLYACDFCWLDADRTQPQQLRVRTLREARAILTGIAGRPEKEP